MTILHHILPVLLPLAVRALAAVAVLLAGAAWRAWGERGE